MKVLSSMHRTLLKRVRSIGTFWVSKRSMEHLEAIRRHEVGVAIDAMPGEGRILELGAGAGWQAKAFADQGYDVEAIDLASTGYREAQVWPVIDYDGHTIPFADASFDILFSSNVMEHIPHFHAFQSEIHRVLKPDGVAIHLVPSGSWRFWTNPAYAARTWQIPHVHGEHASNARSEIATFGRRNWARRFEETGWQIVRYGTNGLFYTGSSVLGPRLSLAVRSKLSRILGNSCHLFVLRQSDSRRAAQDESAATAGATGRRAVA